MVALMATLTCTLRQVGPVLEAMEEVVLALTRALDGRVYVALGRGLWDFTAKEIFDYVESLQEGQENQVTVFILLLYTSARPRPLDPLCMCCIAEL